MSLRGFSAAGRQFEQYIRSTQVARRSEESVLAIKFPRLLAIPFRCKNLASHLHSYYVLARTHPQPGFLPVCDPRLSMNGCLTSFGLFEILLRRSYYSWVSDQLVSVR